MYVGKKPKVLCLFRSPASGSGEVEGKGRLQAVAEGVACGGEAGQEGLGLSYQVRQAAAQGRGAEGEPGMGFQLQKAQFGFGHQGEAGCSFGVVFRRGMLLFACWRKGGMPRLQGFPLGLQGFQQVEEAFLGFQGVGASVRMQEFELVFQLGDIRSNGNHRVFALWKRGNMPPPLAEGCGLHSFFFVAVRPIGLGSSFIFLRCPEEKRTKKKGAQGGKRTRPMASNSFSRGGRHRKRHPHNPQDTKDTCTQSREKNPSHDLKQLFPRRETQKRHLHNPQGTKNTCTQSREKNPGHDLKQLLPKRET